VRSTYHRFSKKLFIAVTCEISGRRDFPIEHAPLWLIDKIETWFKEAMNNRGLILQWLTPGGMESMQ